MIEKKDRKEEKSKKSDKKKNKNEKKKINPLIFVGIICFLFLFSIVFSFINIANSKILPRITIMDINVGNQEKEEAEKNLNDLIEKKISSDIILKYNDYETTINPSQFEMKIEITEAVAKAYNIGRDGNIITNNYAILWNYICPKRLEGNFYINEEALDKALEDINGKLPGGMINSSYYIEDENLIIRRGSEGIVLKKEELKQEIIEKLKDLTINSTITIQIPVENRKPDEIDIEKIREEIYKEAEDAYITQDPVEVHTHVNGVDLGITLEEAKEILQEEKEEYTIPLKITVPEKTTNDLGEEAFPNELGSYSTIYDMSNKNRSNNINLATQKVDGTVILPGETFSYNKIVGQRTIAEGYKEATAYSGGKVVQDVGGGVCQVSSTLYNAALLANLEIVKRSNHSFKTSYVPEGRDATVAWGAIDFQFKNSRSYPIKISAKTNNGVLDIRILGIKEEVEYEVKIQTKIISNIPYSVTYKEDSSLEEGTEIVQQKGANGCKSETYRILKDVTGKIVSQTLLSKDTYNAMERIVVRGTKKVNTTEAKDEIVTTNSNTISTEETTITNANVKAE